MPILPKMMSPICLGLPTLIGSPASSCNSASTRAAGCAKSPHSPDTTWRAIEMPPRPPRPPRRRVAWGHLPSDGARLQQPPQPHDDVGVLGRVGGRPVDRDLIE